MKNNNSHYLSLMLKILLFVDVLIFFGSFTLASIESFEQFLQFDFISKGVIFTITLQLSCLGLGLYKSKLREKFGGIAQRLILAIIISFVLLNILQIFIQSPLYHGQILFNACLFSLILSASFRLILIAFNVLGLARSNVLVLGVGQRALIIEKRMRREIDRKGFNLLGFVSMPGDTEVFINEDNLIKLDTSIIEYVLNNHIHEIVVATDERRENLPVDELFACKIRGVLVSDILDFIERETGQIAVNLIYPSWVIYSEGFTSNNDLRNSLDWLFNACLSLILLVITWPFMLMAYFAIKIENGLFSPAFFWQERVGLNGRIFNMVKFRSMQEDSEPNGAECTSISDPRVTKVGHYLRKYRIDELPQIYNVLAGDMGFVGPRPERPEFVEKFRKIIPYYNERHNVKAGITGWAQLKYPYGADDKDAQEKLKFDLYYIKHRSFMLDLLILIQTAEVVLFGKGR
ncbi:TIGR03013 family PEP-CTERM/XrtA system glycosyltransferase [Thalassotalea nanhaiensis]|uniref:TIGR03013 family PEP-CTERM/XrtA system glycosyltransferase n=1 Tax=Thalassotalea nanhaiensis TaxID=3065648 RepID=A0ABY9TI00_9GAMM|nr:TIGR03013 family PEP-CTERM/XrtA system glycosyltransferase [Colwelliaceae bacterium SQ345]